MTELPTATLHEQRARRFEAPKTKSRAPRKRRRFVFNDGQEPVPLGTVADE